MPKVSVTPTSAQVIAADSARKTLILQNNSDTDIYVRFGAGNTVADSDASAGTKLAANGGSMTLNRVGSVAGIEAEPVNAIHFGTGTKKLAYNAY